MKKKNRADCPHCGAPKRCHPIDAKKQKAEKFPRVCMLDFKPAPQSPLPFELRALTDDDKIEIQDYQLATPSSVKRQ
jgi:hypothetical protein